MAATVQKIGTHVLKSRNPDQTGVDMVMEIHRVKFDSDATVEVPTSLSTIVAVFGGVASDVSAPAANILGCDRIITTGAVTIAATASNSDYFDVMLLGY